jgi:hypothetical protein
MIVLGSIAEGSSVWYFEFWVTRSAGACAACWDLPFGFAQGGELVEPFEIWFLVLGISMIFKHKQRILE